MSAAAQSKKIRVAVAGAGEFGRNHARVYSEIEGAELRFGLGTRHVARPYHLPEIERLAVHFLINRTDNNWRVIGLASTPTAKSSLQDVWRES